MVEAAQLEQRLTFETRTPPVEQPGQQDVNSVARDSNRPDFIRGGDDSASDTSNPADSVEISPEAQRIAANDSENTAQNTAQNDSQETQSRQDLASPVETSATAEIGSTNAGGGTNQVTSFTDERTGNDTQNDTEAGRTLGQVIDTFA